MFTPKIAELVGVGWTDARSLEFTLTLQTLGPTYSFIQAHQDKAEPEVEKSEFGTSLPVGCQHWEGQLNPLNNNATHKIILTPICNYSVAT